MVDFCSDLQSTEYVCECVVCLVYVFVCCVFVCCVYVLLPNTRSAVNDGSRRPVILSSDETVWAVS